MLTPLKSNFLSNIQIPVLIGLFALPEIQDTVPLGKLSDTLSIIGGGISPDFEDQSHLCSGIFYLGIVQMLK